MLLGYLPTSRLEHVTNKAARRRMLTNLYHACMRRMLSPLKGAGVNGILLRSGYGLAHRGHPILAAHASDYMEQQLVTGTKNGECPTCPVRHDELGDPDAVCEPRDLAAILEALAKIHDDPVDFAQACRNAGIKPIYKPFWGELPLCHIFRSITPDILHQLLQGFICILRHGSFSALAVLRWMPAAGGCLQTTISSISPMEFHNCRGSQVVNTSKYPESFLD